MKKNNLPKIFVGLFLFTIASFSFAGYAIKKTQDANPEAFNQIAKHFNLQINKSSNTSFNFNVSDNSDSNYEKAEKTWDLDGNMETLKISTTAAQVTIENSKDGQFHVTAVGMIDKSKSQELFDVESHNEDLFISDDKKTTRDVFLTVEAPANKLHIVQITSISGDQKLLGIQSEQVRLITTSGATYLKAAAVKSIDIKSISGDVEIDNLVPGNIDVKSVSGALKIKSLGLDNSAFALKTTSGDITNPFKSKADAPTKVTASTVSGDIQIIQTK